MDAHNIFAVHSILQLIYHRNKNQHRKTKWWKWLSILKRNTWNLARSLEHVLSLGGIKSSPETYKQYLVTYIFPNCYQAFSMVVADGQFSTLGTVLLGTLARLTKAMGMNKELQTVVQPRKLHVVAPSHAKATEAVDIGEVLARNKESNSSELCTASRLATGHNLKAISKKPKGVMNISAGKENNNKQEHKEHKERKKMKERRKERKKDAIDDLFKGLL
ncbi:hypothetical protein BDV25DRAFT_69228 [Aspergillus avenaceus]|uniref:RNase MRP protein 1 RNA binding domain-containing protein n=1 Tax=Aspergillus avenaceus TaxID=36643 RepID=A0A5N6THD9_ASPAV|nr:hypothetical protein BDV25DRAFT_69228 [Aspergillus avenaceus]